jgi:hypothetical protein
MRALFPLKLVALVALIPAAAPLIAAEKYTGPRPPQADLLYLVHAENLIPLEAAEAKQESGKKDDTIYFVNGPASSARTPVPEPIFLLRSEKVVPDKLELYRMDTKNGRREITMSKNKRRGGPRPLHLNVTRLEGNLYRVEAGETLENGQYSISPTDSNQVFCFEEY